PRKLGVMLAEEVVDELVPRVSGKLIGGIHEAQCGWGNNRLLERLVRVAQRDIEKTVRVALVTKRAAGQPRHAARMTVRKRNLKSVGRRVRQAMHGVGEEVVILSLFAVGDHGRAR